MSPLTGKCIARLRHSALASDSPFNVGRNTRSAAIAVERYRACVGWIPMHPARHRRARGMRAREQRQPRSGWHCPNRGGVPASMAARVCGGVILVKVFVKGWSHRRRHEPYLEPRNRHSFPLSCRVAGRVDNCDEAMRHGAL